MYQLPRFFTHSNRAAAMDRRRARRKPRLDRRNALKHIDYDAGPYSLSVDDDSSSSSSRLITRSLDIPEKTSFRIEGTDGEFDRICRSLGLSGPEDFAIPAAAWEARKIRSSSDLLPRTRMQGLDSPEGEDEKVKDEHQVKGVAKLCEKIPGGLRLGNDAELTQDESAELNECRASSRIGDATELNFNGCRAPSSVSVGGSNGIKGARPPLLKPPPAITLPVVDNTCSTWDMLRDFAPKSDGGVPVSGHLYSSSDEEDEGDKERDEEEDYGEDEENVSKRNPEEEEENPMRVGETAELSESCSFTTSNEDDCSSTTTDPMNISPNGRFKRTITDWLKGDLLGRGSFGSVYEGISHDGFFFAVKQVSLLDQGSQGKQSIYQLEQEIALLSQFEHENIVQYYGTDKDESNLYIFLELITKGSLLNLYQKYHLRDSQVSAYTRQILHGLKYLHDRGVVHRDIKCANILVDANGSVKLADFGLAKATKLNDVKSCKGTAFWMAPEVVNQRGQGYGLPADIWSLGCTVLEMLTHQIPYSNLECMQALFRIGKGEPPPVPDSLSNDARDFILRCIQANPNHRPTAAELLNHTFVRKSLSTSSGSSSPYIGRRN